MKPIFVALDTPDVHRAAAIARDVLGIAGGMKLGLEFFCANGDEGVLRVAEHSTTSPTPCKEPSRQLRASTRRSSRSTLRAGAK